MSVTTASISLNNGRTIPAIGLGVYKASADGEAYSSVLSAIKLGYRHIDTAAVYGNEQDVGKAVKDSGIPREQIWITTKLWNSDHGFERTLKAADVSLKKLGVHYIDLYLMHSPVGGERADTWRAFEKLVADGKVKSIGVSNFGVKHLEELSKTATILPAVNQIELSPYLTRPDIVSYCESKGIRLEAYSPLTKGTKLKDPKLLAVATKYGVSTAQLLVKWGLQRGFITLPKSVNAERIASNADVFGFKISTDDMDALNAFNENLITGWDPTTAD